ncbi:hypothetical protein HMPREF1992_00628 [Selenomonas sp. oral taxon 892 str. F0426]|nr:hypothetical protein HMPREF1992_00628 [Selenomonas sp. oral taxon 892 str. F0426]
MNHKKIPLPLDIKGAEGFRIHFIENIKRTYRLYENKSFHRFT